MKNQDKYKMENKYNKIDDLDYNILGNIFIGNLLDMSGDVDHSGQNIAMYLESEKIKKAKKQV